MKTLHLTLKKKWFDMVGNGKPEDYRDISEWASVRLIDVLHPLRVGPTEFSTISSIFYYSLGLTGKRYKAIEFMMADGCCRPRFYDTVTFTNGYRPDSPRKIFEYGGFIVREGQTDWGAEPGKKYFVIKLGERVSAD